MFKRRGRVLFLDMGAGTRAQMAQAWATELGGQWVEAGAAALGPGVPEPVLARVMGEVGVTAETAPCTSWPQAREDGWDLVVLLEAQREKEWPARFQGLRVKPWHLAGACPAGDTGLGLAELRLCREALRQRVEGLLGGFRLKAREDDNQARMPEDGESR